MNDGRAVRGYIASSAVRGVHYPQRVQNVVVRDYATRRHLAYKLSLTEYAMPGCYMILENVLAELGPQTGIVLFSAFMLPQRASRRRALYERVLCAGAQLHAALENIVLAQPKDIAALEELLEVAALLPAVPGAGRIDKALGVRAGGDLTFWNALAQPDD